MEAKESKPGDLAIKALVLFAVGFIICAGFKAADWLIPDAPREPVRVVYELECSGSGASVNLRF